MRKNILANVPAQDQPVGLHMLTLTDMNTHNRKNPGNMETVKPMWDVGRGRIDSYKNMFPACDKKRMRSGGHVVCVMLL